MNRQRAYSPLARWAPKLALMAGTAVLADPPTLMVEDTVTRYLAELGPAATILFVVRPVWPPALVW